MNLVELTRDVFAVGGPLSAGLDGWEPRDQQIAMSEAVASVFAEPGRLLVEAETGTGKTLAYLIPAILSGRTTIVSTATKTLQEQVFLRDLPMLRRVLGIPFDAVMLKGRRNYLCMLRFTQFDLEPRWKRLEETQHWPRIRRWAALTQTGDRAELGELPDDFAAWNDLSVAGDACLGRECPHYDDCFVMKARRQAAEANIVVVNHHLFFADLALRNDTFAAILPEYDAAIFDEAHNLEEIAASYFGLSVSNFRVDDLLGDIERFARERNTAALDALKPLTAGVRTLSEQFFGHIHRLLKGDESKADIKALLADDQEGAVVARHATLDGALSALHARVAAFSGGGEVAERMAQRCEALQQDLSALIGRDDPTYVYVAERRGRGTFLQAIPIDLGPVFRKLVHASCDHQVYTSATLTTDGNFGFFRKRLALPRDTTEIKLDPVFDYMQQSLLYLPPNLPDPLSSDFIERVAPHMEALLNITEGRAFLLFTSYRNMQKAVELLRNRIAHRVLVQGEMSRAALLDIFRQDVSSVLFATSSFWEGVDVRGESLSLVVIDKLPFASPADPIVKARSQHIDEHGGNSFSEYSMPSAMISLKQGFGRLIRHRDDYGIISILDNRLLTRSYGKRFLATLPRARRTQDIEIVRRWWLARRNAESVTANTSAPDEVRDARNG